MKNLLPSRLQPGANIRVIAPSLSMGILSQETIDNALTNTNDSANELLTIMITMQVATPKITKFFENSTLLERDEEKRI